jgi:WD40 repeat protein
MSLKLKKRLVATMLLLTLVKTALAYDSYVQHDMTVPVTPNPKRFATGNDGALWVTHSDDQLLRIDRNGTSSQFQSRFTPATFTGQVVDRHIYPLRDGGVVLNTHCVFERFGPNSPNNVRIESTGNACNFRSNLDTSAFVIFDKQRANLYGLDGSLMASYPALSGLEFANVELLPEGQGLLLLSQGGQSTSLQRIDAQGRLVWLRSLQESAVRQAATFQIERDNRIVVVFNTASGLELRRYGLDGILQTTQTQRMGLAAELTRYGQWKRDLQGNLALELVLANQQIDALVINTDSGYSKITSNWKKNCLGFFSCDTIGLRYGFARLIEGGAKVAVTVPDQNSDDAFSSGFQYALFLSLGPAGEIVVSNNGEPRAFTPDGISTAPPSLVDKSRPPSVLRSSSINQQNYSFVGLNNYGFGSGYRSEYVAYNSEGIQTWRKVYAGNSSSGDPKIFASNANKVCVKEPNSISCFAPQTGELLGQVSGPSAFKYLESKFLPDGRLRLSVETGDSKLKLFDLAESYQLTEIPVDTGQRLIDRVLAISDEGATLVLGTDIVSNGVSTNYNTSLVLLAPSGATVWRSVEPRLVSANDVSAHFLENGDYVISTPIGTDTVAQLFDRNGVKRWQSQLTAGAATMLIRSDPNRIYFSQSPCQFCSTGPGSLVQALARNDGSVQWARDFKRSRFADLQIDPASQQLIVVGNSNLGQTMWRLNADTGALIEDRFLACETEFCKLSTGRIDSLGNYRVIGSSTDKLFLGLARPKAPKIALDQLGLSGSWYTPQITGQGFFLEYFPANRYLFAPWFTYREGANLDQDTSNGVANLNWYTLSGTVEPGATRARLEIRKSRSGVFDGLPTPTHDVVGSAVLTATDCNTAALEVSFNDSEANGRALTLPLQRLTGGSAPCRIDANHAVAGRDARAPRGGFDTRQSGAWHEQRTSGQGFMFTVQPATDQARGLLFGGWFTFDAGTANDADAQHWLNLIGEIEPSQSGGKVDVKIYRTINGVLGGSPTRNTVVVGNGTLEIKSCSQAIFRYKFDDSLLAQQFAARESAIPLTRIGICPAE